MTALAPKWDVDAPFVESVEVEAGHLDQFGHTNNVQYLRWLEQVAWNHSISLGLDFEAYQQQGTGCVARRHELDYLAATFQGDKLLLGTWVQENDGRLSMWRAYQIIRVKDQKTVLRGRTHWVSVDMRSGRPKRMPAAYVAAYQPAVAR